MKDATVEVKNITMDQTDYVSIYVDSLPRYRNAIGDTLSFDEVFCTLEGQGDIR